MSNRGDGGFIKILRQKLFISLPTSSVGKSFTVAIISRIEKVWLRGGGEYQVFTSKIFCLTVPKISVGESLTVAIISGIEKVWIRGGSIKVFYRNFFVLQCRKFLVWNPLVFHCFRVTKKFGYAGGGV